MNQRNEVINVDYFTFLKKIVSEISLVSKQF